MTTSIGGPGGVVYGNGIGVTCVTGPVGATSYTGPIGPAGHPHTLPPNCQIEACGPPGNVCLYSQKTGFRFLRNLCGDDITDIIYTETGLYVRSSLVTQGFAVFPLLFPRVAVWDPETQLWTNYLDMSDIYMLPSIETAQRMSFIMHKKARMDGQDVPFRTHAAMDYTKLFTRFVPLDILGWQMYLANAAGQTDVYVARHHQLDGRWPYAYGQPRAGTPEEIELDGRVSSYLREKLPQKALLRCYVGQDHFYILEHVSKFYWEKVVARMLPDFDCGERRITWVCEDELNTVNVLLWVSYDKKESIPWGTWEEAFEVPT